MPKVPTQLIGRSEAFRESLDASRIAAGRNSPVLIYGETGSGKGVIADFIHRKSHRPGKLISLNCASFQASLFESELFGHVKGSFTGALNDKPGLFEVAEGGTLFLDEIGDTPPELQPKLLRALEEGVIRRVGGTKEIPIDVRLICATNRNLEELIEQGKFREDLFYRINAFVISLPPLRDRADDIPHLARHFLDEAATRSLDLSADAAQILSVYKWPGNIRELRSAMSYAAAQAEEAGVVRPEHLPEAITLESEKAVSDDNDDHLELFENLYRRGGEDPTQWARFLLAFNQHLGSNKFSRGDVLECLRQVRGPEPTDSALVNEWQRHVKPLPLRFGLVIEEGKKLRIDIDACRQLLAASDGEISDDSFEEIETAAAPVSLPTQHKTNLDTARTTFVGRAQELEQLEDLIRRGTPNLITITGPGGTGKTRLSREVGRRLTSSFPGGVWFADLTESRNVEGVAYAVAHALGVPMTGQKSPELSIADLLEIRPPTVLILDNFEQVAEVASAMVGDWARQAPHVRFVVTSRALLGIEGEYELSLESLPLPDQDSTPKQLRENEAVRLFVERARIQHVGFVLDDSSTIAVSDICRKVEGMPLAIELAAARITVMKPQQISDRLDSLFDLLKSSRRDLAPRQRSLTATLDWSFDLLTEDERWAFAQLSIFRGGFFLEAAEAVIDMSKFPDAPSVLDMIQSLREKSLLRVMETPFETSFSMYVAIRAYAEHKWTELASEVEQSDVWTRVADFYLGYATRWDKRVFSPEAVEALDRLDLARANFVGILNWSRKTRPDVFVDLTLALNYLFRIRGPAQERAPRLRTALDALEPDDPAKRCRLLVLLSQAEREAGDPAVGAEVANEAVELSGSLSDERSAAMAKFNLAGIEYASGHVDRTQDLHNEVLPTFRKIGDRDNEARVLSRMALLHADKGEFEAALERSRESEELLTEIGDMAGLGFAASIRGNVFHRMGRHEDALKHIERAERMFRKLNDRRMIAMCLGNRALIDRQLRRFELAEPLVEECGTLAREIGDKLTWAKNEMNSGIMYVELGRYDEAEEAFDRAAIVFEAQKIRGLQSVCVENLAFIKGLRNQFAEAYAGFDTAMNLVDDETLRAGVLTSWAEILIRDNKYAEARAKAEAAETHWRNHPSPEGRDWFRTLTSVAQASAMLGDSKRAAAAASEALSLSKILHYRDSDPSPSVRHELEILKKIATS